MSMAMSHGHLITFIADCRGGTSKPQEQLVQHWLALLLVGAVACFIDSNSVYADSIASMAGSPIDIFPAIPFLFTEPSFVQKLS